MYINATGFYLPEQRIPNSFYTERAGLTDDWIVQRTGIKTRARAQANENINTMGLEAVRNALPWLPYDIKDVDLIVAATYSPYDTVGTAAHVVQHAYGIENAKAFTISSACSSFVNALEIIEGYFACGKARKALIIGGDKNSAYSNEDDPKAGHLWGDTAVAFFISNERVHEKDYEVWRFTPRRSVRSGKALKASSCVRATGESVCPKAKTSSYRRARTCLKMPNACWKREAIRSTISATSSDIRLICAS